MQLRLMAAVCAALALAGLMAAGPAEARKRHDRVPPQCIDRPAPLTFEGIIFNARPVPNGCAPPVFANGEYVGQDPDPFIRQYLRHDPESGYSGPQH
jgi:hypothetical protein